MSDSGVARKPQARAQAQNRWCPVASGSLHPATPHEFVSLSRKAKSLRRRRFFTSLRMTCSTRTSLSCCVDKAFRLHTSRARSTALRLLGSAIRYWKLATGHSSAAEHASKLLRALLQQPIRKLIAERRSKLLVSPNTSPRPKPRPSLRNRRYGMPASAEFASAPSAVGAAQQPSEPHVAFISGPLAVRGV